MRERSQRTPNWILSQENWPSGQQGWPPSEPGVVGVRRDLGARAQLILRSTRRNVSKAKEITGAKWGQQ